MQSIDEILKIIKDRNLNVLEISRKSGIPSTRIYKWIGNKGRPKSEDSDKLRDWAGKNLELLPQNPTLGDANGEMKLSVPSEKEMAARYIAGLERDKEYYQNLFKSNLNEILILSRALKLEVSSAREVSLRSLSRLEGKDEDALLEEAGRLMIARGMAGLEKDKTAGMGK